MRAFMIIDIHSHMINKNFDLKTYKHNFTTKMFFLRLQTKNFEQYYQKMSTSLTESKVDKAVLCAIENVVTCSNNEQTAQICANNPNFLYGANLNPLDKDIEKKFNQALKDKAVLVKILPSYQNIDLSDKKCINFFEMLKDSNMPLLVHTGIEHTIKGGNQDLNNPDRLELAAKIGVKVIAAHCGVKLNFWEKDYFENWCNLARKYENFYGDLGAMILFYRHDYLKKLKNNKELSSKLLFATDFPCYPYINLNKKQDNIFNDWYDCFISLGFNDEIFKKAKNLIKVY